LHTRLSCLAAALGLLAGIGSAWGQVTLSSPDDSVSIEIEAAGGNLQYSVVSGGLTVIETSRLGISVDGVNLGSSVSSVSGNTPTETNETYDWHGVKSTATNHYKQMTVDVTRTGPGDASFQMIWRAYDDGIAFRYRVPGSGSRELGGEATGFSLPANTTIWYQDNTENYEALYENADLGQLDATIGPPATCLVGGSPNQPARYVAITEGALLDYPGMRLATDQNSRRLAADIADDTWQSSGGSLTPWRIAIITDNLNALVNSTLVPNVNDPPAANLDNADWIRPGRALWSWFAFRDENSDARVVDQKPYMDAAVQLGFDYVVWDDGWGNWSEADFDELLQYAHDNNIRVWLWMRWNWLESQTQQNDFFDRIDEWNAQVGSKTIVGIKLDFMDSESKPIIQWYEDILERSAQRQLLINFHGANKPTGTERTYPNELTREAVRGLEYHSFGVPLEPVHNTALPFTRMLAGHCDYTPTTFRDDYLGKTTYGQQLAMAFLLTSPLTHWADDPANYLESPARFLIESAPTVWDETIVLPGSQIGYIALMARRSGNHWYVTGANADGNLSQSIDVDLSFLGPQQYEVREVKDVPGSKTQLVTSNRSVTDTDTLTVTMEPAGGYVAWIQSGDGPFLTVTPTSLDATGEVGLPISSESLQIGNTGQETMSYTISTDAPWLSVSPSSGNVAPGGSITATVQFDSTGLEVGSYDASITISGNALNAPKTVDVTLQMTAPTSPQIQVSPLSFDMEAFRGQSPSPEALTITNPGFGPLDFSIASNATWLTTGVTTGTIASGEQQSVSVLFNTAALAIGDYSGVLTISHNAPDAPSVQVAVELEVIPQPGKIRLDPTVLEPSTLVNEFAPSQQFELINDGGSALRYTLSASRSWLTLNRTSGSISIGQSHTVTVTYQSANLPPGEHLAFVTATNTDVPTDERKLPIQLTVIGPRLKAEPPALEQTTPMTESPPNESITLSNSGGGTLSFTATGTVDWLDLSPATGTIEKGETLPATLTFNTFNLPPGTYEGAIEFTGNLTGGVAYLIVHLVVEGPQLAVSTDTLEHAVTRGETASPKTITINNVGAGPLSYQLTADAAWLDASPKSGVVASGDSATITLDFDSADLSTGRHRTILHVYDTDGGSGERTVEVNLHVDGPAIGVTRQRIDLELHPNRQFTYEELAVLNDGLGTLHFAVSPPIETWITSITPSQSMVADGLAPIAISFDTRALPPGVYDQDLIITSADADPPQRSVPVRLMVVPLPRSADIDGDQVTNDRDNCPDVKNANQADGDNDGIGTICDNCSQVPNPDQADTDGDTVGDVCDVCPEVHDPLQLDRDNDGIGDACEPRSEDPDEPDDQDDPVDEPSDPGEEEPPADDDSDDDLTGDAPDDGNEGETNDPDPNDNSEEHSDDDMGDNDADDNDADQPTPTTAPPCGAVSSPMLGLMCVAMFSLNAIRGRMTRRHKRARASQ
jgi:hypothetical protein